MTGIDEYFLLKACCNFNLSVKNKTLKGGLTKRFKGFSCGRGETQHGEYAFSDGEEVRLNSLAIDPQNPETAWITEDFMMIVSAAGKKRIKESEQ